jgi:hypothetical protein
MAPATTQERSSNMARIQLKRQLALTARELKKRVAQGMRDRGGASPRCKRMQRQLAKVERLRQELHKI